MTTLDEAQALRETEALVERLNSRHVSERIAARQELQALGADAVPRLVALIRREHGKRRARRRVYFAILTGVSAIVLPGVAACIWVATHGNPGALGGIGGLLGGGYGGFGGGFAWLLNPTQREYQAAQHLKGVPDKRAVGALALALETLDQSRTLRQGAAEALFNLLPQLTEQDGELLDENQRACLRRAALRCSRERDAEFIIRIVDALSTIGDLRARPQIEQLAAAPATTPDERAIHEAADAALRHLEEVHERQRQSDLLLRPTTDPSAQRQVLLRPAHGSDDTDQALLLRPSAGD